MMKKNMIMGLSALVAISSLSLTGCNEKSHASEPTEATILSVEAVTKTVTTPHQVCEQVAVTHKVAPKDENKVLGTIAGAVAGGVLGHQVGGGNGKKVATVAGAVAGGVAGNMAQGKYQEGHTTTTMEKRCHTENSKTEQTIGYDVTYKLGDDKDTIRMEHKPTGDTLAVKDGKVVI
ncbi:glycine zipper 2TM domain-containing protein [Photobacterium angustum]|nr:glycine zipper 2TM domain-containing protein [Photobacterium angustum]